MRPGAERAPSVLHDADLLYDSSNVPHASRWSLPLPAVQVSLDYLDKTLAGTLALLANTADTDEALYFFRLALFHEDMHNEAAVYMAQSLGFAMDGVAETMPGTGGVIAVPAGTHEAGWPGAGFAFDNELAVHEVSLGAFEIDRSLVSNAQFMAFVEDAGYDQQRHWSDAGWAWRMQHQQSCPRYVQTQNGRWMRNTFGEMRELRPDLPASNLSWHEAQAWCRWAGRRLPTDGSGSMPSCPRVCWTGARCGSGRPRRSNPIQASSPIRTATIRRPGSALTRCCAAHRSPPMRA